MNTLRIQHELSRAISLIELQDQEGSVSTMLVCASSHLIHLRNSSISNRFGTLPTKRMRFETNYPQKLWISQGLTNLEGNGRSKLEVDWLFFAQDDSVTDSRYCTETYRSEAGRLSASVPSTLPIYHAGRKLNLGMLPL
jgi:hypothetical protein